VHLHHPLHLVSLVLLLHFVTVGPDNCFEDAAQLPPLLKLPLENLDEDLECCLWRVSFFFPWYSHVIALALIDCSCS
jgi:hypothetical protein